MKSFKQYLVESNEQSPLRKLRDFLVSKSAQSAGMFQSGSFFYRGLTNEAVNGTEVLEVDNGRFMFKVFQIEINQDRKSTDMSQSISRMVNDWLERNLGEPYRERSVFASSRFSTARRYGSGLVGMVFPASNSAKWIYSPGIRDLYDDLDGPPPGNGWSGYGGDDDDDEEDQETEWTETSIGAFLSSVEWITTKDPASAAATHQGEVMLFDDHSKSYYLVALWDSDVGKWSRDLNDWKTAMSS